MTGCQQAMCCYPSCKCNVPLPPSQPRVIYTLTPIGEINPGELLRPDTIVRVRKPT